MGDLMPASTLAEGGTSARGMHSGETVALPTARGTGTKNGSETATNRARLLPRPRATPRWWSPMVKPAAAKKKLKTWWMALM